MGGREHGRSATQGALPERKGAACGPARGPGRSNVASCSGGPGQPGAGPGAGERKLAPALVFQHSRNLCTS